MNYYSSFDSHAASTSYGSADGLAPTISKVKQESNKVATELDDYQGLLAELMASDFVKAMQDLQKDIIG